jgi:hypothetical protein
MAVFRDDLVVLLPELRAVARGRFWYGPRKSPHDHGTRSASLVWSPENGRFRETQDSRRGG